jgi:hypothetical protein
MNNHGVNLLVHLKAVPDESCLNLITQDPDIVLSLWNAVLVDDDQIFEGFESGLAKSMSRQFAQPQCSK